jgi:hypothetical protein
MQGSVMFTVMAVLSTQTLYCFVVITTELKNKIHCASCKYISLDVSLCVELVRYSGKCLLGISMVHKRC